MDDLVRRELDETEVTARLLFDDPGTDVGAAGKVYSADVFVDVHRDGDSPFEYLFFVFLLELWLLSGRTRCTRSQIRRQLSAS